EAEGIEGRRLHDGHVVRRLDRRRRDVRAGARANVEQRAGANLPADWFKQLAFVQRFEETKGVAAADEEDVRAFEIVRAVAKLRCLETHPTESFGNARRVSIAIFSRERRKHNTPLLANKPTNRFLGMIEEAVTVNVRRRDQKESHQNL